jgi:hypothetical protein
MKSKAKYHRQKETYNPAELVMTFAAVHVLATSILVN